LQSEEEEEEEREDGREGRRKRIGIVVGPCRVLHFCRGKEGGRGTTALMLLILFRLPQWL